MKLAQHIITRVRSLTLRNRYPRLIGKNARLPEHGYGHDISALEIITDRGAKGWGVGRCDKTLCRYLIGKRLDTVFDPAVGILDDAAFEADIALHDLAGNILGQSVARMLSPQSRAAVDCYDGAIYMNDIAPDGRLKSVETILEDCRRDHGELGYNAFKVKVGRGGMWMTPKEGLKRDIAVIRAIRRAFPDSAIMADGNDKFTLESVKAFIDGVADCGLYWLEEPFPETVEGFEELRAYLSRKSPGTLIADGEFAWDTNLLMALADRGLIDVLLMDTYLYGFTNWRKLLPELSRRGLMASPHCWGDKLKTHYAAHLAAAFDAAPTVEGVLDITEGVDYSGYALQGGRLAIPDRSGFGMPLVWGRENPVALIPTW